MALKNSVNRWKAQFEKTISFFSSPQDRKYFPSERYVQDPVLELLHEHRRQSGAPSLLLIRLTDYRLLVQTYTYDKIRPLVSLMKAELPSALSELVPEPVIIGMKQFGEEDFGVFLKDTGMNTYDVLDKLAANLVTKLESRLQSYLEQSGMDRISISHSSFIIDREQPFTAFAVQEAYFYARMTASRNLPARYNPYKEQLQTILDDQNIIVLAQPIMNLNNGGVFGWEILTRGPKNTPFYSPSALFEYAYQSDLLIHMECLTVHKAFLEISSRQVSEQVFINVTSISLSHPIFLNYLLEQLELFPIIRPTRLIFEITERHEITDYFEMGMIIEKYRSFGFRFAVDDAGSGYSSLLAISELIPDIIKIDKSLIQNIDQITVKRSILKALMSFAQDMQCQVVAEGIEREEEAEVLFQYEVHMGQGFYFARPEPLAQSVDREHMRPMQNRIKLMREQAANV